MFLYEDAIVLWHWIYPKGVVYLCTRSAVISYRTKLGFIVWSCLVNQPTIKRRVVIGSLGDPYFAVIVSSSPAEKWGRGKTLGNGALMTELSNAAHFNRLLTNCLRRFFSPKQCAIFPFIFDGQFWLSFTRVVLKWNYVKKMCLTFSWVFTKKNECL